VGPTYIYGIVPTDRHLTLPGDGVSRQAGEIHTLPYKDIAAVVGPSDLDDYRGLGREELVQVLLDHQRVAERVMRIFPILPAKFSTVLADERRVVDLLTKGYDLFRNQLEWLAGCSQMEVVVQWDLKEVFAELGSGERVTQIRELAATATPEQATELRILAGRMVQAVLEERRAEYQAQLLPRLRKCGRDSISNPCMDDSMILNLALLLDAEGRARLDALLPELDGECEGRLNFRCVGPLPPYSFASLEVETPSFSDVDRSRRLLDLPEDVSVREVKEAYHRQAARVHPDVNPEAPEGTLSMSDLSSAYALLTRFVESQTEDKAAMFRLDVRSVEEALLFDVVRQEVLPD
jgi:hypothetical protein